MNEDKNPNDEIFVEGYWKNQDGMSTCCPNGKDSSGIYRSL
jgi:hypothetical protein